VQDRARVVNSDFDIAYSATTVEGR